MIPVLKVTLGSDMKRQGWARVIIWSETFHPVVDMKGQDLTLTVGSVEDLLFFIFFLMCRSCNK